MIDEPAIAIEHGGFRRDLNVALFDQRVLQIAKRRKLVAEFPLVLADRLGDSALVRIDQPEREPGLRY